MNYKEIADIITLALMLKTMEIMALKEKREITREDVKAFHKEKCEMVQDMLKDFYDITDYVKFAEMIQRCDAMQLLFTVAGNQEMLEKAMYETIEKQANDCLVQIEAVN